MQRPTRSLKSGRGGKGGGGGWAEGRGQRAWIGHDFNLDSTTWQHTTLPSGMPNGKRENRNKNKHRTGSCGKGPTWRVKKRAADGGRVNDLWRGMPGPSSAESHGPEASIHHDDPTKLEAEEGKHRSRGASEEHERRRHCHRRSAVLASGARKARVSGAEVIRAEARAEGVEDADLACSKAGRREVEEAVPAAAGVRQASAIKAVELGDDLSVAVGCGSSLLQTEELVELEETLDGHSAF